VKTNRKDRFVWKDSLEVEKMKVIRNRRNRRKVVKGMMRMLRMMSWIHSLRKKRRMNNR